MCTSIVEVVPAEGAARGQTGWFSLTHSVVAYDHPQRALLEEAVVIDFVNPSEGPHARAAVELTLDAAKALQAALSQVIEAAEQEEGERTQYAGPSHPHWRGSSLTQAPRGERPRAAHLTWAESQRRS